ncbi:MAG: hypothetical protein HYX90_09870 [Chloroflexi bacterium]|nr:hypothetical protein [Chloroflexota bacterium]
MGPQLAMKCHSDVAASAGDAGVEQLDIAAHRPAAVRSSGRHVIVGIAAAAAVLGVYVLIVSFAQGVKHALDQTWSLRYWMGPLAIGFGAQAGLFSYLREGLRRRRAAATASVAASGGISTGSMLACCAHHLSDVLPLFGIAGAATFLASYQALFLEIGIISNIVGIAFMVDAVQCAGLAMPGPFKKWKMRLVRNWTAGFGLVAVAAALAVTIVR